MRPGLEKPTLGRLRQPDQALEALLEPLGGHGGRLTIQGLLHAFHHLGHLATRLDARLREDGLEDGSNTIPLPFIVGYLKQISGDIQTVVAQLSEIVEVLGSLTHTQLL